MKVSDYVGACWKLSRAPFLSVGLLPLILGFVMAWRWGYIGPQGFTSFPSSLLFSSCG